MSDAVTLSQRDLDDMLERAAERGAVKALASVGLSDPQAIDDVRGLRGLMQAYRVVRTGALKQIGQTIALVVLGAVVYVVGGKIKAWTGT